MVAASRMALLGCQQPLLADKWQQTLLTDNNCNGNGADEQRRVGSRKGSALTVTRGIV